MLIDDLQNPYLQNVIREVALDSMQLLEHCEFKDDVWDLYISGLSFGIYVSLCDEEYLSEDDIYDMINEKITTFLN